MAGNSNGKEKKKKKFIPIAKRISLIKLKRSSKVKIKKKK
jgi:hypothetical protein